MPAKPPAYCSCELVAASIAVHPRCCNFQAVHPEGSEVGDADCTWLSREPEMKSDGWLGCGATAVIMSRCPCIQHSTSLPAAGLRASPKHCRDRMLPCRLLQNR